MKKLKSTLLTLLMLAIGAIFGFFIASSDKINVFENSLEILLTLAFLYISFLICIIVHEFGHLICGKLSGYDFVSFRAGSLTLIKANGKYMRKKYSIVGTAGQCIMSPPDTKDYNYPFTMYLLGGSIANFIFAALHIIPLFFVSSFIYTTILISAALNIILGLTNIIPFKIGGIANDGLCVLDCRKDATTRRAMWIQLKYAAQITNGTRIKDMPKEWMSDTGVPENPLMGFLAVLRSGYLLDKGEREQAQEHIKNVLANPGKMLELHQNELRCELLFFELINECREEEIKRLRTPELINHMKAFSSHLSKQRLAYAYECLYTKNNSKAQEFLEQFEKTCNQTPYLGEVPGERELLKLINTNNIV